MAGGFLTSELKNRINLKYSSLFVNDYIAKILKENHVRVCEGFQKVEKNIVYKHRFMSRFIELPDKNKIVLNEELFEVGELMFSPQLFGFDFLPMAHVLSKTLKVRHPLTEELADRPAGAVYGKLDSDWRQFRVRLL